MKNHRRRSIETSLFTRHRHIICKIIDTSRLNDKRLVIAEDICGNKLELFINKLDGEGNALRESMGNGLYLLYAMPGYVFEFVNKTLTRTGGLRERRDSLERQKLERLFEFCKTTNAKYKMLGYKQILDIWRGKLVLIVSAESTSILAQDYVDMIKFEDLRESQHRITEIRIDNSKCLTDAKFTNFSNLRKLTLGENVDSIPKQCFTNTPIEEIVFPKSLTKIGTAAFRGTKLKSIKFQSVVKYIGQSAFARIQATEFVYPNGLGSNWNNSVTGDNLKHVVLNKTMHDNPILYLANTDCVISVPDEIYDSFERKKTIFEIDINEISHTKGYHNIKCKHRIYR